MADYITVDNLDEIVEQNKKISIAVEEELFFLLHQYNQDGRIKSEEKLAFNILKKHGLIQIPLENRHWGGAIYFVNDKRIPVINTALPRVNQYFVAWHELYHLLCEKTWKDKVYEVSVELSIQERKADYFAAKALMGNVYQYYMELKKEDFLDNIALCMDLYQVPYKAILIQLYEESKAYKDYKLQEIIKRYFDLRNINWKERFQKLGLDQELVEASNVFYLGYLEEKIAEKLTSEPEVSAHELNKRYLDSLKEKVKILLCSKE